ncbi:MAG: pilus assembly protein [Thauera sp.]|nr:pilus assembly protein [Thauera sp.]
MTTSAKASLLALSIAALPLSVQAAGLGQINVFSGLGQPLRAEIQISATAQELQSLSARIASAEAFRRANLSYGSAVNAIRVSVDTRASRPVVRLTSDRPVNDPFVDLLVELDWAGGNLVREYTFLLDPVELSAPRPLAAAVEAPAVRPARGAARPSAAVSAPMRAASVTRAPADTWTVRRGDTMHRIASATAHSGTTLDQMLIALLRANPQAFDGGNINRLRAGTVLNVPGADAVRAIDVAEARSEIRAQAADFDAYRRGLATSVAGRAPAPAAAAVQESGGRIVPRVQESAAATAAGDKVTVSRSDAGAGADAGAEARLQVLEEELTTRSKALEEANDRLVQLERSIRDLQRLLEVQSGTMGQLQAAAGAPAESPAVAEAPAPAQPVDAPPVQASAPAGAPATATEAAPTPAAPAAAPVAAAPVPAPKPPAAPVAAPVAAAEPVIEPTFVDTLMEDPTLLYGGGGILALLLAYAGLKARQRRKEEEIRAAEAALGAASVGTGGQSVFAGTGGQSVDTGATSIMHTDFSHSGLSSIDTDEGVDPVAEADVYMAYGRDAQAEEILQDALKADPGRAAIHLKLLEIYAQRRSTRQFETIASELFARTGGQGRDWEKAAALGRRLDPENPLYDTERAEAGAQRPPETAPAPVAAAAGVAVAAAAPAAAVAQTGPELASLDFTAAAAAQPSHSQMRDTWTLPGELNKLASGEREGDAAAGEGSAALAGAGDGAPSEPMADEIPFETGALDFELDLADETPTAMPDLSATTPGLGREFDLTLESPDEEPPAPLPADDGVLTFDLDLGEPDEAEGIAPVEPRPVAAFETTPAMAPEHAAAEAFASAPTISVEDSGTISNLEFELPGMEAPSGEAFDLDATMVSSTGTLDDEPAVRQPASPPDAGEAVVDLEKTAFDSSLLDFDFELDAPAAPTSAAMPAGLDLTSIDLDLEAQPADAAVGFDAVPFSVAETQFDQPAGGGVEEAEPVNEEAETKLELARAYEEMGDKEGALELLEEVVSEGSPRQQVTARDMIARLG